MEKADNNKQHYIIGLLAIGYAANQLDRHIVAVLLVPIKMEFGASDVELGLLTGLTFAAFYTVCGVPLARLADRSNRRNIVALSQAAFSFFTLLSGLVPSFALLVAARIGVAVGEAGSTPASVSLLADTVRPDARARAMSIFTSGSFVGFLVAAFAGGWIAESYGWRVAFFLAAIPGMLVAFLMLATVREPIRHTAEPGGRVDVSLVDAFRLFAGKKALRHLLAGVALSSLGMSALAVWLPTLLFRTQSLPLGMIGLILAATFGLGGAAGTIAMGYVADRLGYRDVAWNLRAVALASAVAGFFTVGMLLTSDIAWLVAMLIIPGALGSSYAGPAVAMCQALVPEQMRGLVTSIYLIAVNLVGYAIGTVLPGLLSDVLAPSFGQNALRIALLLTSPVLLWSAFHFWLGSRYLAKEIHMIAER